MDEVHQPLSKTTKLVVGMFVVMLTLMGAALIRPHQPSPLSAGSGYGTGHGASSIMLGASPRKGAAR